MQAPTAARPARTLAALQDPTRITCRIASRTGQGHCGSCQQGTVPLPTGRCVLYRRAHLQPDHLDFAARNQHGARTHPTGVGAWAILAPVSLCAGTVWPTPRMQQLQPVGPPLSLARHPSPLPPALHRRGRPVDCWQRLGWITSGALPERTLRVLPLQPARPLQHHHEARDATNSPAGPASYVACLETGLSALEVGR